jgi:hypothetical protein
LVEWKLAGEPEILEENLPSATLSTTNSTWSNLGPIYGFYMGLYVYSLSRTKFKIAAARFLCSSNAVIL